MYQYISNFSLLKKYIPKYLSIIRCIDKRFETGEIYIKWDDTIEADWLILIYIKIIKIF